METALITGASRGIGAATARVFAQNGWQVAVNYNKSEENAKKLVNEINAGGGRALAFRADVRSQNEVLKMVEAAEICLGKISSLVCCAGVSNGQALLTDAAEEDWDELFGVNAKGAFFCLKAALPGMVERKRGSVVLVSSVWGAGRFLRGGLLRQQGLADRPCQSARKGARPFGDPGELRRPGRDRNTDERPSLRERPCGPLRIDAPRADRQAGGSGPSRVFSRFRRRVLHHRPGARGGRGLFRLRRRKAALRAQCFLR